ncbi:hypothetical protein NNC19_16795 [Clostridium sp. SHJSY1]|uniref:hypothetical protein n=1 Tax=Clostridium sp. SHJSY1 TaxID=2942483 RepID=UPI002876545F|nr:hypothetical protein [Clostridium sp. SHJSY1]MDS0527350.1 hypothetical protein [Clostridium sp. SHJSY1]
MSQVIDSKTEKHSYAALFAKENIETTLTLIYTESSGSFRVNYDSKFSGIKEGHIQGGPIDISGNTSIVVNNNPKVSVIISQFHYDIPNNYISLHITITVDIPIIGNQIIYNQTLSGTSNTTLTN